MGDQKFSGLFVTDYRLLEQIGSGGFSYIYRARHIKTDEIVAIKFLRSKFSQDNTTIERFKREAQSLNALNHPNIIKMKEMDWNEDLGFFLVLEWLNGEGLKDYLLRNNAPFVLQDVMFIFDQLFAGLGEAHRHGIVHRDIKPANMMFVLDNDKTLLKILDFGIARLVDLESHITTPGMVMGSAHYMSPEQALGRADEIDLRSDLYSCGCLLAKCLTGRTPFRGNTYEVALLHHKKTHIPTLKELYPAGYFSEDLESVFARSIAREKSRRFQSSYDFQRALERVMSLEKLPVSHEPDLMFTMESQTTETSVYHSSLDELSELILTASQDSLVATIEDLPAIISVTDTFENKDTSTTIEDFDGKKTTPIFVKAERILFTSQEDDFSLNSFEKKANKDLEDTFDYKDKKPLDKTVDLVKHKRSNNLIKTIDLGELLDSPPDAKEKNVEVISKKKREFMKKEALSLSSLRDKEGFLETKKTEDSED